MHLSIGLAMALAVGAQAQSDNPLNSFISAVASVVSDIDPATTSRPKTTSHASTTSHSSPSSTSHTPTTTSPSSTTAAGAAASTSAAAAAAAGGLSTRDKIIIAVCVVVGVLLLLALALCLCCCLRRRRKKRARREEIARDGREWSKHHSADSAVLGTHRNGYEKRGLFHRGHERDGAPHDEYNGGYVHHGHEPNAAGYGALPAVDEHGDRYGHRGLGNNHHHGEELAAGAAGMAGGAALARHSEASDRGLIGATHDHDRGDRYRRSGVSSEYGDARMSGVSGTRDPFRNSNTSGLPRHSDVSGLSGPVADASPITPTSPSGGAGMARKPVPGRGVSGDSSHNALLGAGAAGAGALAGAAAMHHHDKHNSDLADGEDYHNNRADDIPATNRYSAPWAGAAAADRQNDPRSTTDYVEDNNNYHIKPYSGEPMYYENRPPTPFGLAAFGNTSHASAQHEQHPVQDEQPFTETREPGSSSDALYANHGRTAYHHSHPPFNQNDFVPVVQHDPYAPPTETQRRSLQDRELEQQAGEGAYIPYTPQGPYDAALASARRGSQGSQGPGISDPRYSSSSMSNPQRSSTGDARQSSSSTTNSLRHSQALANEPPPPLPSQRSLYRQSLPNEAPPPLPDQQGPQRQSLPAEAPPPRPPFVGTGERRSSGSVPRVPTGAVGAVGRGSPRIGAENGGIPTPLDIMKRGRQWTPPGAWQVDSSRSGSEGRSSGSDGSGNRREPVRGGERDGWRNSDGMAPSARPSYPGKASYNEAPTPSYEIPGAFPDEYPPRAPGMMDQRRSGASGNGSPVRMPGGGGGSPARSGRRLRFSDHNEEYEIYPEHGLSHQHDGVGQAM